MKTISFNKSEFATVDSLDLIALFEYLTYEFNLKLNGFASCNIYAPKIELDKKAKTMLTFSCVIQVWKDKEAGFGTKYIYRNYRAKTWSCSSQSLEKLSIRGIYINSYTKEIKEVEIVPTLEEYYKIIGCNMIESACPQLRMDVPFKYACTMYVDEEGALKEENTVFRFDGSTIKGNALIVGWKTDGSDIDCPLRVDEIEGRVSFHTL